MNIIEFQNINYSYDNDNKLSVLKNVNFKIEEKDFFAIIGKTGSGKSTILQLTNGLLKPQNGKILFRNKNIFDADYKLKELRFKLSLLFQYPDYQLFAETVIEDIMFGAINKGMNKEEANEEAIKILKKLQIEHLKDAIPFNLSGGEKRKVALAGILIMKPEVLLLDEPEAGLDPFSKDEMFEMFRILNDEGITIIFVSHNYEDVVEYANKVLLIEKGEVIKIDTPFNIFNDDNLLKKYDIKKPYVLRLNDNMNSKFSNYDIKKVKYNDCIDEITKVYTK